MKQIDNSRIEWPSYGLLGFKITPLTKQQIVDLIAATIERNGRCVIASQNLHGIYIYFKDEKFRALHDLAHVHIDGTPIIWLGRLAGLPVRTEHRTAWIDWFIPLMQEAARSGWRVYYLGSEQDVLETGLARIEALCPGIRIAGRNGFFDPRPDHPENRAIVREINAFRPQILVVGMGMGRQERWILDNLDRLEVNCIGTSGACMELIAGKLGIPPRWMGPAGIEWLYRLWQEPRRVGWRYFVEPWLVAWFLLRHRLRLGPGARRGK